MDFSAAAALETISFSSPPTTDIVRNFRGADATHVTSHLLTHDRRARQNCLGRVTYREDLVEMSGGITGLQHRFCLQWSFFLVCVSPVRGTQDNRSRPLSVSSSKIFLDLSHLQNVPWMGVAWRWHTRR